MKKNMPPQRDDLLTPIDAVITWVNGSSESHRRKRQLHMSQAEAPLHENATNPHRWACNDEILYCLQSIENHAPWVGRIWIVVDEDTPDLRSLSDKLRAKVTFVFHHEIFDEYIEFLPTFNSLAIETLLWRIPGLSERFIYFNDDVFLSAPLKPTDVFQGLTPVLRGQWVDYAETLKKPSVRRDPAKFNHYMQLNAARILGFEDTRFFASAHVVHPMLKSVMSRLFDQHKRAFVSNIRHRFRDLSQFLPQGLFSHASIAAQKAVLIRVPDHLHIKSGQGRDRCPTETLSLLGKAANSAFKFLCVNDLPQLELVVPEAREWISLAIGGFVDHQALPINQEPVSVTNELTFLSDDLFLEQA